MADRYRIAVQVTQEDCLAARSLPPCSLFDRFPVEAREYLAAFSRELAKARRVAMALAEMPSENRIQIVAGVGRG